MRFLILALRLSQLATTNDGCLAERQAGSLRVRESHRASPLVRTPENALDGWAVGQKCELARSGYPQLSSGVADERRWLRRRHGLNFRPPTSADRKL